MRYINKLKIIPLFILPIYLITCSPKPITNTFNEVQFSHQNQKTMISNDKRNSKLKTPWSQVTLKDPNSGNELTYLGYYLKDLVVELKDKLNVKQNVVLKITSKDGYVVKLSSKQVEEKSAFLALEIHGVSRKGIFNKSLNSYFDWRPGYILFPKQDHNSEPKVSSPYQVTKVEIVSDDLSSSFLEATAKEYRPGAKAFIKSCNKCHSHLGLGGHKAPPIEFLTPRWKSDQKLMSFVKEPQKTIGRKIQMSGFYGSQKELDDLILFLRSIEHKKK